MSKVTRMENAAGEVSWLARWRDPAGVQRKKTFARKGTANDFLTKVGADLLRGTYIDLNAGRLTIAEYGPAWMLTLVHVRASTRSLYGSHFKNHVLPVLGNRPLGSLHRTDCKNFVALLSQTLQPTTVRVVYAVLRSMMQAAVDDGLIHSNPCTKVPLPKVERRVLTPLDPALVVEVAAAMPARYQLAVWLGAGAGMREGEALGLTGPRVDFLRRRLHIEEQVQGVNGSVPVLVPLKTKASFRTVPLDDIVLEKITEHMRSYQPGPQGVLITGKTNLAVRRSSFITAWRTAADQVGMPAGTRFHDLRHFYASALIDAGMHPKAIQDRLGHATITETMDTYGHLFSHAEDAGRGALQNLLCPPRAFLAGVETKHAGQRPKNG